MRSEVLISGVALEHLKPRSRAEGREQYREVVLAWPGVVPFQMDLNAKPDHRAAAQVPATGTAPTPISGPAGHAVGAVAFHSVESVAALPRRWPSGPLGFLRRSAPCPGPAP